MSDVWLISIWFMLHFLCGLPCRCWQHCNGALSHFSIVAFIILVVIVIFNALESLCGYHPNKGQGFNPYCFLLCFWNSIMKGESWNILALCFNKSYLKKANLKSTRRNSHATAHKAYHFRSICQWCFVFFGQFTQINWSLNVPRVVCCSTSYFPELPSWCMYHFNPECSLGLLGPLLFF